MSETVFADGISVFKPREGRPSFVKGTISMDAKRLQEWLHTHPEHRDEKGFVRLDILESSKEGNKWYLAVDTFKPETTQATADVPVIDATGIPF